MKKGSIKRLLALAMSAVTVLSAVTPVFAFGTYDDNTQLRNQAIEKALQIQEEGSVLLKNNDNALPLDLKEDAKVNIFGATSVDPVYNGGGSGNTRVNSSLVVSFYDALEDAGIQYNEELRSWYEAWYSTNNNVRAYYQYEQGQADFGNPFGTARTMNSEPPLQHLVNPTLGWSEVENDLDDDGNIVYQLNEQSELVKKSDHPEDGHTHLDNQWEKALAYTNETAVILIGRAGSESADIQEGELKLRQSEKDLIAQARKDYNRVIVLYNICNVMEMGYLDDVTELITPISYDAGDYADSYQSDKDEIDAAMIIWATGEVAFTAVAELLTGERSPSGRLTDTISYQISDHPASENFGDFAYTSGTTFLEYEEGIYIGYRFFETFEQTGKVQFPFGYGLSYTDFEWEDIGTIQDNGDTLTVDITVKNMGNKAAKDVVQLYFTAPYTESGIEKSKNVLAGYAKTKMLEPGETDTVTIVADKYYMSSYDMDNLCYILEAGEYTFQIAASLNGKNTNGENIKSTQVLALNEVRYDQDPATGTEYSNQFGDASLTSVLSRNSYVEGIDPVNWDTYPDRPASDLDQPFAAYSLEEQLPEPLDGQPVLFSQEYQETIYLSDVYNLARKKAGITDFFSAAEEEKIVFEDIYFNDEEVNELWNMFLSQLTIEEAIDLLGDCGYQTPAVLRLGIPDTEDDDGPQQLKRDGFFQGRNSPAGLAYPVQTTLSSTWNDELARELGEQVGLDGIEIGTHVWYAPGINMHRTPMGGRNFEYYSEDPLLAGKIAANITAGARSQGLIVTLKHFALNDCETNRNGVATFADEQTIREIYLKPFEIAVKEGRAMGIMTSYNRIGTIWAGAHEPLLKNVLRDEWGFKGFVLTDNWEWSMRGSDEYMHPVLAIYRYNDAILSGFGWKSSLWGGGATGYTELVKDFYDRDPAGFGLAIRAAAKNVCYMKSFTHAIDSELSEYYKIAVEADETVSMNLDTTVASAGETINFTIDINDTSRKIDRVTVYTNCGYARVIISTDGIYSFTMPDENVLLKVSLKENESMDTNFLEYIISIADNYMANGDLDKITAIAKDEFETAYKNAQDILDKANTNPAAVTQTQVNTAACDLLAAFQYLELKVDKEMLQMLILLADSILDNLDDYIPNSINGLKSVLDEAKEIALSQTVTNKEINQTVIKVIDEIDKARLRPDKSALANLITDMRALDKNLYTEISFKALIIAVEDGEAVLNDENADADDVNSKVKAIQNAYANLEKINGSGENPDSEDTNSSESESDSKQSESSSDSKQSESSGGTKQSGESGNRKNSISGKQSSAKLNSPKTGDTNSILILTLVLISAAAILMVSKRKTR